MEKRILFITDTPDGFLITAMEKSLVAAGYEIIIKQPHPKEISCIDRLPNIFIVYLDGDEMRFNSTLQFLGEQLTKMGTNRYLYLIGNPIEIETAYRIIPHQLVSGSFERPVNTSDLITQLDILCTDYTFDPDNSGVEKVFKGKEDISKKSILIVDDDATLLRSMQTWLSKKYNIFITNSGMNTISFLKERMVDLILLDYEMPILSGLEVFQILKNDPSTSSIPVIFLTSKDDKDVVLKVLEARPVNYLLKPMPPSILLQTVNDFFKLKEEQEKQRAIMESKSKLTDANLKTPAPSDDDFGILEELEELEELESVD